jgi:hypothetical protein
MQSALKRTLHLHVKVHYFCSFPSLYTCVVVVFPKPIFILSLFLAATIKPITKQTTPVIIYPIIILILNAP